MSAKSLIECLDRAPELGPILVRVIEDVLGLTVGVVYLHEGDAAIVRAIGDFGESAGVKVGDSLPWSDTLCSRIEGTEPHFTCDAAHSPVFADAPHRAAFGITTYIGAPILDEDGCTVGSVCAVDQESKPLDERDVRTLQALMVSFARMAEEAALGRRTLVR